MDARSIPSDATLVWLASERAAPLFRTLDRTKAFGPLVVLLAALPPVLATFAETMTSVDAAWGLWALEATGSNLPPQAAAVANTIVPVEAIRPAALWLSAALMRLADPARPVSGSLASLIGGAALLGLLWPLAKELSGRRFAFWAVLLAAFHPTLTALLLFPAPVTVGLALAVAALWGHLSLDGKPFRVAIAGTVVAASIAAGLWLVGRMAWLVPFVIAVDTVLALLLALRNPAEPRSGRRRIGPAETAFRRAAAATIGVTIGIGAALLVPQGSLLSPEPNAAASAEIERLEPAIEAAEAVIVGPLWGLAAIGLGRLLRIVHRRAAVRGTRSVPRLLLVWLLLAGGAVLWTGEAAEVRFDPVNRYVLGLASLPLLLSAAYAIEEAARRLVSGAWILLAVALPMAVRLGSLMAMVSSDNPLLWIILGGAIAAAAWFMARAVPAAVSLPGLRRGMLVWAILLVIAVNMADGLAVLFRAASGDETYGDVTAQLIDERPTEAVVLLTDGAPPPELTFALRASYPRAAMEIAATWEEAATRLERQLGPGEHKTVVAAWGMRETAGATSAEELHPTGEPLLFAGRELLLYVAGAVPRRATELPGTVQKSP